MGRILRGSLAVGILAAAGLTGTTPALADTDTVTAQFVMILPNPCGNGDGILFRGTLTMTTHVSEDGAGGYPLKTTNRLQGEGPSVLSGVNSRADDTASAITNAHPPFPQTFHTSERYTLRASDPTVPDERTVATLHYTV